jgi:hypothetical protein
MLYGFGNANNHPPRQSVEVLEDIVVEFVQDMVCQPYRAMWCSPCKAWGSHDDYLVEDSHFFRLFWSIKARSMDETISNLVRVLMNELLGCALLYNDNVSP